MVVVVVVVGYGCGCGCGCCCCCGSGQIQLARNEQSPLAQRPIIVDLVAVVTVAVVVAVVILVVVVGSASRRALWRQRSVAFTVFRSVGPRKCAPHPAERAKEGGASCCMMLLLQLPSPGFLLRESRPAF